MNNGWTNTRLVTASDTNSLSMFGLIRHGSTESVLMVCLSIMSRLVFASQMVSDLDVKWPFDSSYEWRVIKRCGTNVFPVVGQGLDTGMCVSEAETGS